MKHIVLTGKFRGAFQNLLDTSEFKVHTVLRKGYTLVAGYQCNNGRPITESYKYKQAIINGIHIIHEYNGPVNDTLLVDKYAPKLLSEVIGHREQINQLGEWLKSWNSDGEYKAALITGPPGIGKTTTAHLVAKVLGYKIAEYNASDTRSAGALKELFTAGVKRIRNEVIIMDEVDGISDRGGIGQIAEIIRGTTCPVICIANERALKLKPLMNICLDIKFSRPMRSTIAAGIEKIAKKEGIKITKLELEELCERNGNDIRAILNNLHFGAKGDDKDSVLRLDAFSATQRLIGNKGISIDDATNLVFVDYSMVPLMVSEGYIGAARNSLEDAVKAADLLSCGDLMARKIHSTQDWNMLPHYVTNTVAIAKSVKGPSPFHIFPQWLGKNSKQLKHKRLIRDVSRRARIPANAFRLDYCDSIQRIILGGEQDAKKIVGTMTDLHLTRDDLFETIGDLTLGQLDGIELATKTKTAITREYNKVIAAGKKGKRRSQVSQVSQVFEEGDGDIEDWNDEEDDDDDDGIIRIL